MKRQTTNTKSKLPACRPAGRNRPKKVGLVRFLILACLLASATAAFAVDPASLDIALKKVDSSQPPRMLGDVLVLSYKPGAFTRFVGARFAHEGWRVLHPYALNERGVFVLDYPVPEGVRQIRYRIVVDGLWMPDPANPQTELDSTGTAFSSFTLEQEPRRAIVNPRFEGDNAVTFVFTAAPGRRVSLVGDFNNWDPFMDALEETAPGTYTITRRVSKGAHWYYFFMDGRRILDRYNAETGVDPDGAKVSAFSLSS